METAPVQYHDNKLGQGQLSPTLQERGGAAGGGMEEGGEVEPAVCNACKEGLDEETDVSVVSFGKYLFHVGCFRCAKCHNLVEHSTNLLLLSDGSPVCENCSYICSVCHKPIHNEAIVTGDESYHGDCFRCRSCSNKIEELIFAKTNQGIWCMKCHNERVARTRKHAEAKRNRQARKEKEGVAGAAGASSSASASGSRSTGSRRPSEREHRERDRDREKALRPGGDEGDRTMTMSMDVPDVPGQGPTPSTSAQDILSVTAASSSSVPVRPLPPSPIPPRNPSFDGAGAADTHRRAQTTPGEAPRATPPYPLAPSHSAQSLHTLSASSPSGRPTTPLHAPSLSAHSRTSSQMSAGEGSGSTAPERRTSASQLRQEINASSSSPRASAEGSRRPSTESSRGAEQKDFQPYPLPESPRHAQYGTGSEQEMLRQQQQQVGGPRSPTSEAGFLANGSRQGSLSAPSGAAGGGGVDKAANRRSGFYGLGAPPRSSVDEGGQRSTSPIPPPSPPPPASSTSPTPNSFLPDLHQSMSFYDPDTLLFLNHVGSAPSSPKAAASGGGGGKNKALPDLTFNLDDGAIERLSPSPGPVDVSGSEEDDGGEDVGVPGGRRNDIARKVRESIHVAKRESGQQQGGGGTGQAAGGLDVELVEMLLKELEETKKEMKEIKGKYNAFRRASRSAFEGFSMAREEYDKEVALRRDAERQMDTLRTKFLEQAKRLAQVDQEQRTADHLKRQSKDLRNSVVGIQKHLSELKTEVALSTAQIAELAALGKEETKVADRSSTASAVQDEVAEALDARLEAIKDVHRDEVNALIAQRDDLLREVADLKETRDAILEETNRLAGQNAALVEKNADASRQLDQVQDTLSRLQLMSSKTGLAAPNGRSASGHSHTPSSSSLSSSLAPSNVSTAARSPLATARVIGSPNDLGDSFRFAKPEAVEVHSRNKFKWGKSTSKSTASSSSNSTSTGDSSSKNQQLPPVPAGAKSPVPPRAGSVDSGSTGGVRQHVFQQTSILRPVRCDYCGDKMWGLNEVRCTACGSYSHAKCAAYLTGCDPSGGRHGSHSHGGGNGNDDTLTFTPTGPPMFGNDLVTQAMLEGRDIPVVVSKCIDAVEAYGTTYEGIYRKTGGMGQTKLITQYFERGLDFDLQDRDKFNDLAAITSCMKNYFRSLPVPLFTHDLHEEFVSAAEQPEGEGRLKAVETALYKLPPVHFHTARLLFLHLNHIKSKAAENKMTSANLGVVFGPTVLRSPVPAREWSDMGPKAKIVEILCDYAERLFSRNYSPQS